VGIISLISTFGVKDAQQQVLGVTFFKTLSALVLIVVMLIDAECRYSEYPYAECHYPECLLLNVVAQICKIISSDDISGLSSLTSLLAEIPVYRINHILSQKSQFIAQITVYCINHSLSQKLQFIT